MTGASISTVKFSLFSLMFTAGMVVPVGKFFSNQNSKHPWLKNCGRTRRNGETCVHFFK